MNGFPEFNLPEIPYSKNFIDKRKMSTRLKIVNDNFCKFYGKNLRVKTFKVTFDSIYVQFYYQENLSYF